MTGETGLVQRPIEDFCCQWSECLDHGRRGAGNLSFRGCGGARKQIRMIYCRTCKKVFSERRGTPLFGGSLAPEKALSVLEHLREGCGTRATARLVGVHRDTVTRLARLAGNHASSLHGELLAFSPETREVQLDEKWSFVFKKEKKCDAASPADATHGDRWDHTAIDPEHALLLAMVPGRRTEEVCHKVVQQVKERTGGRTDLLLTTDEHAPYTAAIKDVYGVEAPQAQEPGPECRPKPGKEVPEDLCYATVKKTRQQGRITRVVQTIVFGTILLLSTYLSRSTVSSTINTSFVERHNGTDRAQNARKARRTYRFSKAQDVHDAVSFFVGYSYNFCWVVRTLRDPRTGERGHTTAGVSAGLTDHVWSLGEWITLPAIPLQPK